MMDNVFELIARNYTAAESLQDADYTPSTRELLERLVDHTGKDDITLEAVFSFMENTGFIQQDLGDLFLVWLMKSDLPVLSYR